MKTIILACVLFLLTSVLLVLPLSYLSRAMRTRRNARLQRHLETQQGLRGQAPLRTLQLPSMQRYHKVRLVSKHEEHNMHAIYAVASKFDLYVFTKVRLIDVIAANSPQDSEAVNKVIRKHVDFLLCDHDFMPICVIEVDDSTHRTLSAQKRDAEKDLALADAGVPIFRTYTVKQAEFEYRLMQILTPLLHEQEAKMGT